MDSNFFHMLATSGQSSFGTITSIGAFVGTIYLRLIMVNGPIMLSSSWIMIDNNHEDRFIGKGTKHELPSPNLQTLL